MNFRLELHHVVAAFLIVFGAGPLLLPNEAGVTTAIRSWGWSPMPIGILAIAGGVAYIVVDHIHLSDSSKRIWHFTCTLSLSPYTFFSYVYWIQSQSGNAAIAYSFMHLMMAAIVAYNYELITLKGILNRLISGKQT